MACPLSSHYNRDWCIAHWTCLEIAGNSLWFWIRIYHAHQFLWYTSLTVSNLCRKLIYQTIDKIPAMSHPLIWVTECERGVIAPVCLYTLKTCLWNVQLATQNLKTQNSVLRNAYVQFKVIAHTTLTYILLKRPLLFHAKNLHKLRHLGYPDTTCIGSLLRFSHRHVMTSCWSFVHVSSCCHQCPLRYFRTRQWMWHVFKNL